jgi:DNA repair ATPase RecN
LAWFRKKKRERLRECRIGLSPGCAPFFRSEHKRPNACDACRSYLKERGIYAYKYYRLRLRGWSKSRIFKKYGREKMDIKKGAKVKESIVWKNSEEGVMTVELETPIRDEKRDNKVSGTRKEIFTVNTFYQDIVDGLKEIEARTAKKVEEVRKLDSQLAELGKLPFKSNEIVRLQKNLEIINKIERAKQLESMKKPIMDQMALDAEWMETRKKLLETRPAREEFNPIEKEEKVTEVEVEENVSETPKEEEGTE